jgi:hypothetical protein
MVSTILPRGAVDKSVRHKLLPSKHCESKEIVVIAILGLGRMVTLSVAVQVPAGPVPVNETV